MILRSVTLSLGADEVRRALLSLKLDRFFVYDVGLGYGRLDLSVRTETAIPVPARLRLELAGFSGVVICFRVRFPAFLGPSGSHVLDGSWEFPGLRRSGEDFLELDLAVFSRGAIESLRLTDVQITPDGVMLSASDLKLRADWNDIFAS